MSVINFNNLKEEIEKFDNNLSNMNYDQKILELHTLVDILKTKVDNVFSIYNIIFDLQSKLIPIIAVNNLYDD